MRDRSELKIDLVIGLVIAAITLAVYWQVLGFGFVMLDDPAYVAKNPHVLQGLSPDSIKWAFTTSIQSNWHPLTWISLMTDARIGGGSPSVFHATNILLHIANALLLYFLLRLTIGFRWRSGAVAALFAIHPLHVESVAWVTERKDVLSTLFWLLTMLAYVWYAKRPSVPRYALVLVGFALGLMAKPMLVSLPLVLLLMDIWPLKRDVGWSRLVLEKLPMFALASASCVVTYWAQSTGGSVATMDVYPVGVRLANALVAFWAYIVKMVCPLNLVVIYPHPNRSLPVWQVLVSGLFFAAMLAIAMRSVKKRPYLTVGWLWYVLTMLPVIGLVQVGQQAMADRYTYVPMIGLFLVLAMGIPELFERVGMAGPKQKPSQALVFLGAMIFVGLASLSFFQAGYWESGVTLCEHAISVDNQNYLAHAGMGNSLFELGKPKDAVGEYLTAIRLSKPSGAAIVEAHYNLGLALYKLKRYSAAVEQYNYVLQYAPRNSDAHNSLGYTLLKLGQTDPAIQHLRTALEIDPHNDRARTNLGCALAAKREYDSAIVECKKALSDNPANPLARKDLAAAEAAKSAGASGELKSGAKGAQ